MARYAIVGEALDPPMRVEIPLRGGDLWRSAQSQLRLATRSSVSIAAFELPGSSGSSMIAS